MLAGGEQSARTSNDIFIVFALTAHLPLEITIIHIDDPTPEDLMGNGVGASEGGGEKWVGR